jgi:hypothetical protein
VVNLRGMMQNGLAHLGRGAPCNVVLGALASVLLAPPARAAPEGSGTQQKPPDVIEPVR